MIDRMTTPEGEDEYGIVRRDEPPSEQFKDEYWWRVERTLQEVFRSDPSAARERRKLVDGASPETQTIFYHADPFEVAADLAGRRGEPITPEEKQRYVKIKNLAEPPSDDDLRPGRPEDKP